MSHIGKKLINIPSNVTVSILSNNIITIKGKFGLLKKKIFKDFIIVLDSNLIIIKKNKETKFLNKLYGLTRTIIENMIIGVNQKFFKKLIIEGVGYKFQITNNYLLIFAGFSYINKLLIPSNINITLESPTKIILSSINKEKLGLYISKIKSIKSTEPYKGKGILEDGEIIKRKIIKKGK
jgi:large subunit ribosomal protein L6